MGQYDFDTRNTGDNVVEENAINDSLSYIVNKFLNNVILKTIIFRAATGEIGAEERDM